MFDPRCSFRIADVRLAWRICGIGKPRRFSGSRVYGEAANPSSHDRTPPSRYPICRIARSSALPRERFSPMAQTGDWKPGYLTVLSILPEQRRRTSPSTSVNKQCGGFDAELAGRLVVCGSLTGATTSTCHFQPGGFKCKSFRQYKPELSLALSSCFRPSTDEPSRPIQRWTE